MRLVILGATGDLTSRYLAPALVELAADGLLPPGFEVIGLGRQDFDTEAFRSHLEEQIAAGDRPPGEAIRQLLSVTRYARADLTDPGSLAAALAGDDADRDGEPIIAYLALPPVVFAPAIEALAGAGLLGEGSRVVVEKPFGTDLASAQRLNALLHRLLPESAVYRIDHFLGHQTVQNILGLRFANRVFEPVWNNHHVERVEVVWDETLALEGRAGYYDHAGALLDMVQNHLLQLLCLVAMEPPTTLSSRDLRDRKVELLRAVRRMDADEAARCTVRGRYVAGRVGERQVPDYVDEDGVDPANGTETFAQVTFHVDNWRWAGTAFTLRTGKALATDFHEITVWFKPVPHLAFGQAEEPSPNVLRLGLGPDLLSLGVEVNGPDDPFTLEPVELSCELAPQRLGAYARLLLDVMEGDPVLSIRDDEAEEAWRIVEPVLTAWASDAVPLLEYPAGTAGPTPPG